MSAQRLQRIVVVGTGTEVGKTRLSVALARALRRRGATLALKPVESGGSADAQAFHVENPFHVEPHPLFALARPLSPHLAARLEGRHIDLAEVARWVREQELRLTTYDTTSPYVFSLIETAGGVLSPLSREARNLELARALEPATLLLVAPDSLGVLSSLGATLLALRALGREPDLVALSAARQDDSTGTNAAELRDLGIAEPAFVLGPGQDDAEPLAEALVRRVSS